MQNFNGQKVSNTLPMGKLLGLALKLFILPFQILGILVTPVLFILCVMGFWPAALFFVKPGQPGKADNPVKP